MKAQSEHSSKEMKEVQSEIAALRKDIRGIIEVANGQHTDMRLEGLRREYGDVFIEEQLSGADQRLQERMIQDCPMHDQCYMMFYEVLKNSAGYIREGEIQEEVVRSFRDRLAELEKGGAF